jgi:hypothetical protein
VKRHYTLAYAMRRDAYEHYLQLMQQYRDNEHAPLTFDRSILPESQLDPQVVFVCKNYKVETGLSHHLHAHTDADV